jgi:uncharacterized membrane protein YpjA
MYSSSRESGNIGKVPLSGAILTGCLVASVVLFLMAVMGPELFMSQPLALILWCLGVAFSVAILDTLGYLLGIPLLIRGITFIVSQWIGLWGRIWLATHTIPPLFFNPSPVLKAEWLWCLLAAAIWGAISGFHRTLARLSQTPKRIAIQEKDASHADIDYRLILVRWRKDWQAWRVVITALMAVSVLIFGVQFPVMHASQSLKRMMVVLFLGEVATGFMLLTGGFFYFKRACWKLEGVEPDSRIKPIWYQWFGVLFGGIGILSILIPADFGRYDEWWAQILTLLSKTHNTAPPAPLKSKDWVEPGMLQYMNLNILNPMVKGAIKVIMIIAVAIPSLVLLITVLILLGYLCTKLYPSFSREVENIRGLPKVLIKIYQYWLNRYRNWRDWIGAGAKNKLIDEAGVFEVFSDMEKFNQGHSWGRGTQAIIRRGYYRMVHLARSRGLHWQPTQTPQEIASGLNELIPDEGNAIREITSNYQQARYGQHEPPPEKVRLFERLRRGLENRLRVFMK